MIRQAETIAVITTGLSVLKSELQLLNILQYFNRTPKIAELYLINQNYKDIHIKPLPTFCTMYV